MAIAVTFTGDPSRALAEAGRFLLADPVRNFTMITLLRERVARPEPGRYWVVKRDGEAAGVLFWSPVDFPNVLVTRMDADAVDAVVEAIDGMSEELDLESSPLRGVSGPAASAAAFAGSWTEVSGYGATPVGGQRLYEATPVPVEAPLAAPRLAAGQSSPSHAEPSGAAGFPSPPGDAGQGEGFFTLSPSTGERWREGKGLPARQASAGRSERRPYRENATPGHLRQAVPHDRDLLVEWMRGFLVNNPHADPARMVDTRLPAARFWIWDDNGPVSAACQSEPQEGVVSIQAVYTPSHLRNRGYATACVAALTARILASGHRPILYTNLANPTSNSIYREIGYKAVEEVIRYRFEAQT
jgi:GNAT superfamily N-acetyltransferase